MPDRRTRPLALLLTLTLVGATGCPPELLDDHVKDDEPDTYGLSEIGHTTFYAVDDAREGRTLKLDVWYPVDDADVDPAILSMYALLGPFGLAADIALANNAISDVPARKLIVFSHGFRGINTQSTPLMETLASHGFIVVAPEHTGNSQFDPSDDFVPAAEKRVPDVTFTIDTMFARSADPSDRFRGRIDTTGVGVVGHSFGGMTSVGTATGWAGAPPDPRVVAIAPISAVIDGELQEDDRDVPEAGFPLEDLAAIDIPVMLLGGTLDTNVPIENNAVAFDALTVSPAYRADIVGATHTHFANICAIGSLLLDDLGIPMSAWELIGAKALIRPYNDTCTPEAFPIDEAVRLQNLYVVAFFRKHLLGEAQYDDYLTEAYALANEPDVVFFRK